LTMFSIAIAIGGALLVSVLFVDLSYETFLSGIKDSFKMSDLFAGLVKAWVFGAIIGLVGCREGFYAGGGARGVGTATTQAVVISAVMVLISDYIIATILFRV